MPLPFGNQPVTLYHRTETGAIVRYYLTHCSWRATRERALRDGMMQSKTGTACICRYPADQPRGATGDVYVLGHVRDVAGTVAELADVVDRYRTQERAFMCETFTDNSVSTSMLAHFCARGA